MKIFYCNLPILLLLCILSGCIYQIQDVRSLPASTQFNRVNLRDKKISAPLPPDQIPAPYVVSIYDLQAAEDLKNVPHIQEYLKAFDDQIYDRILYGSRRSMLVTRNGENNENYLSRKHRIYEIKSRLTRLETGNGWLRYFVGWGAGDIQMQVEGTVTDALDGKTILAFVMGERTNGDPNMAWNVKVVSDRYTIKKAIKKLLVRWYEDIQVVL